MNGSREIADDDAKVAGAEHAVEPEAAAVEEAGTEAGDEDADAPDPEPAAAPARETVDPRGSRFGAVITSVVLAVALLLIPGPASVVLLVVQGLAFGAGAILGLRFQPYGWIYRQWILPRVGPPVEREDAAPPRFAQVVGVGFIVLALVGLAFGVTMLALIATAFAFAAAFLNAAFGFCLGCEMYLRVKRLTHRG